MRSFSRSIVCLATAAMMSVVASIAVIPYHAYAQENELPVAQFVHSDGELYCNTAGVVNASYHAAIDINVPVTTILAGLESEMATAAAQGQRPHGVEGKNRTPYIDYNFTFPHRVSFGTITTTNNSSLIDSDKIISTKADRSVNVKIYLKDLNWQQIYNLYSADKANPSAHTVKITIPYATSTPYPSEAAEFSQAKIIGKGSFAYYSSDTLAEQAPRVAPDMAYSTDTVSLPFMEDASSCFNLAPMKTTRYIDEETGLEVRPSVAGVNFAQFVEIPGYIFSGVERRYGSLTGTYKYRKPFSDIASDNSSTIDADMLESTNGGAFDTQHGAAISLQGSSAVFDVKTTASIDDIRGGKIAEILEKYKNDADASLRDVQLTFEVDLTLPEQLQFTRSSTVSVTDNDNFDVDNVVISGRKAQAMISLKKVNSITRFNQLKQILDNLDANLAVVVKSVTFAGSAQSNTNYTMTVTKLLEHSREQFQENSKS
ncbi:hypothetical protein EJ419_03170 [Alloscardovia theropitheci]|uniref:Isopeptide-forming domain-containing fimbrial protein n=1 Tax=Alloscardovia theropitheci TaxID=2496842 RepID=A0A4R0QXU2_9BIFI|nr:hypothetical protein [Alloscardovia theropitheci]TCD54490.1 hypothetical protein EJ419_03170 [Alloscardovia theropitheci]